MVLWRKNNRKEYNAKVTPASMTWPPPSLHFDRNYIILSFLVL